MILAFCTPWTSLLPAVAYTSNGQDNEDSKASRKEGKKNMNDFTAITWAMGTKEK